jgi:aspartate/methionine/tyrosine aminotransferase
MYVFFGITQPSVYDASVSDDVTFARALLTEENVFLLPGTASD